MSAGFRSSDFTDPLGGLSRFKDAVHRAREEGLRGIGLLLEGQVKNQLSTPGRGRVRRHRIKMQRGRKATKIGRAGRASAPGDSPAPDTGALRGSILYHIVDDKHVVGTNQVQAPALEFGTKRAGRGRRTVILPRPFMRPAFEKVRREMSEMFGAALRAGFK